MRPLHLLAFAVCCAAILPTTAASAEPAQTTIGIHLVALRSVNVREGSFEADFYLWMRYATPNDPQVAKDIETIEFINGSVDTNVENDRKQIGAETYVAWRIRGTFTFKPQLEAYPFDRQALTIVLEHPNLETSDLVYAVDSESYQRSSQHKQLWGVGDGVDIPEFRLDHTRFDSTREHYTTDFGDPTVRSGSTYSRLTYSVVLHRRFGPYMLKILVPLFIILCLAYLVFYIPADSLEVASGLTVTSLLACIAFQLSLAGDLPEVGYLVSSDRLFHLCYAMIMLAMVETVWTYNLAKNGREVLADRIEWHCRWAYPAIFVVGTALIAGHGLAIA